MTLPHWIQPQYLHPTPLQQLRHRFLRAKPFPHLVLPDFFEEELLLAIRHQLTKERFSLRETDLYAFKQTQDLKAANDKLLRVVRELLMSKKFIALVERLTDCPLKRSLDLSASVYTDTDYLLCHDDRLEGRVLAFMIYLSTLRAADGGRLLLYDSKNGRPVRVRRHIVSRFNTFVLFRVSKTSFHAVEEVTSKKERITLSGWFHGK